MIDFSQYIKGYEFLLLPLYIIAFFFTASKIVRKYYYDSVLGTYFYLGLAAKLTGSIAFALMSQYFFKEGDTFMYFSGGLDFKKAAFENFPSGLYHFFEDAEDFNRHYTSTFDNTNNFGYLGKTSNLFAAKISSVISILTFNGYLLTSLFFGLIAFSGMWRMFSLFSKMYPVLTKQNALIFLFLPSILYWGGGIMKDTLCLGAIGWLFTSFYEYFILSKKKWNRLISIAVSLYSLLALKGYIGLSLGAVLIVWIASNAIISLKNIFLRRIILAGLILTVLGLATIFADEIINSFSNNIFIMVTDTIAESYKNYQMVNSDDGASLSGMGDVQPNLLSILSKVPLAINNALFRPYIWEARKLNILFSAVENTFLLIFTLWVFIRRGVLTTFKKIFSNQLIFFFFVFTILFAVLIGFTCFNYGSLVRYKLPCLPFFGFMLVLLYKTKNNTNNSVV